MAPEHFIREPTRGAEGREAGLQRKDKLIKKRRLKERVLNLLFASTSAGANRRRLKEISRLKRAGEYWKKEGSLRRPQVRGTKKKDIINRAGL